MKNTKKTNTIRKEPKLSDVQVQKMRECEKAATFLLNRYFREREKDLLVAQS